MNVTRIRTELAGLLRELGKKDRSPVDLMYLGFRFGCCWYAGLHAGRKTAVSDAVKNPEFESKVRRNENGEFSSKAATGAAVHKQLTTTVNEETGKAIRAYSTLGNSFPRIQACARNGNGDAETMRQVALIEQAIMQKRLSRNSIVYRGVTRMPEIMKLQVGDTYSPRGFVSTSTKKDTAADFAGKGVLFEIHLKKGTPALSIGQSRSRDGRKLQYVDEKEILLNRGTQFVVRERQWKKRNGRKYMVLVLEKHSSRQQFTMSGLPF